MLSVIICLPPYQRTISKLPTNIKDDGFRRLCFFYLCTGESRSPPFSAWWAASPILEALPNTADSRSPPSRPSTSASCRPGGERPPWQALEGREGECKWEQAIGYRVIQRTLTDSHPCWNSWYELKTAKGNKMLFDYHLAVYIPFCGGFVVILSIPHSLFIRWEQ